MPQRSEEQIVFVARAIWRGVVGYEFNGSRFEDIDMAEQNHYKFLASRAVVALDTFDIYKTMKAAQDPQSVIFEEGTHCPKPECSKLNAHLPPCA